jgi:hypothetical protein
MGHCRREPATGYIPAKTWDFHKLAASLKSGEERDMKLPKIPAEEAPPAGEAQPRKSPWTMILNSTPVVLTVLATVLAGISSSEMTLAQYHRALAAQNQSKAGDQWGFFQAKRIRGMSIQSTIELLTARSAADTIDARTLSHYADELVLDIERLKRLATELNVQIGKDNTAPVKILAEPVDKLQKTLIARGQEAADARDRLKKLLDEPQLKDAVSYLSSDKLPSAATKPIAEPKIVEAKGAVLSRQSEQETDPLVKDISAAALHQAIETVEANILAVEKANKPIGEALGPLDKIVQRQAAAARDVARALRPVERALEDLPEGAAALHVLGGQIARADRALHDNVEELTNDYRVAQNGYLFRRYKSEADRNEEAATIYEVQVRKSSQSAEQHRDRSKHFFYCMLAAQAGVTIATLSLAFKRRSVLWGLASLAGLSAVSVSVYVYLYR